MPIKEIWNGARRLWKDCGGEEKCKEEEEEEEGEGSGEGEERKKWGRDNERKGRKEKGMPMNKTKRAIWFTININTSHHKSP